MIDDLFDKRRRFYEALSLPRRFDDYSELFDSKEYRIYCNIWDNGNAVIFVEYGLQKLPEGSILHRTRFKVDITVDRAMCFAHKKYFKFMSRLCDYAKDREET